MTISVDRGGKPIDLFLGLVIVMPVLRLATRHLYRKLVACGTESRRAPSFDRWNAQTAITPGSLFPAAFGSRTK